MQVRDGGRHVKSQRKRRRFSQRDLAGLARCSQNTISLIETGGMKTISDELALRIADRLDVDVEVLFVAREASVVFGATSGGRAVGQAVAS